MFDVIKLKLKLKPHHTNSLLLLLTAPASQAGRLYNCTVTASQAGMLYSHTQTSAATMYYVFAVELYFLQTKGFGFFLSQNSKIIRGSKAAF